MSEPYPKATGRRGVSRRNLLKSSAAGVAAVLAERTRPIWADGEAPSAIDAHTHFYDPTRPQGVPWPGKDDKVLYRPVLPDEFQELTRPQHISGTIVIEASAWLEDNQWLLDLAARTPLMLGVVGRLDLSNADFAGNLERFGKDALFRGIRINHDELKRALSQPKLLEQARRLAAKDLELDVNGGPDMPADVSRLARAIPDLRIVINHAANLTIEGKGVPDGWRSGMRAAAANERVYCKVSALVEGTRKTNQDAPSDVGFYRPVLDALWNLFGEDRLIYGSNWPVNERAASYATVYQIVYTYFQQKGSLALKKFLRQNAQAAYKVG
jgi:L-fuconolactonase